MSEETIAAMATASGDAAISLIRISGAGAAACVCAATGRGDLPERRSVLARVRTVEGRSIDQGLLTFFPGPGSFTGEDVVEFTGHGGNLVSGLVLRRFFECGARPAEPGEFSQRAFLNGKLDLTQAEAIMDIISAKSESALWMAQEQLEGVLATEILDLRERITDFLVELEAYIDFPDENLDTATEAAFLVKFERLEGIMNQLLESAERGRKLREGIRIVIAGAPNAGKSSLLNWLTGRERAIVSSTPGTTRDVLEELVVWEGLPLLLIDTAGLRFSTDEIEIEGVRRAELELSRADVVLEVVDATSAEQRVVFESEAPRVLVWNKVDLLDDVRNRDGVAISCRSRTGSVELMTAIREAAGTEVSGRPSERVAVNARHRYLLSLARERIRAGQEAFVGGLPAEITAMEIREALQAVGGIVGRVDVEDILGGIFARFCIGK